jgi:hypothetical protein
MSGELVAGLLAFTFISRWWPRLIRPGARDSDTYYHLLCAENIRRHRFKLPSSHPQFILPSGYSYAPVYHYLLALFPRRAREQFEKASSALFDTLLVGIFLWAAARLLGPAGWDERTVVLLGLGFSLSPALVGMGIGPRAYQGTPRTMGQMLTAGCFTLLWAWWWADGGLRLGAVVLLGAMLPLTSAFSGQVLLFFCVVMSLLLGSPTLLLLPGVCAVAAIVLSYGHYWRMLQTQIKHLRLYARRIAGEHPGIARRLTAVRPTTLVDWGKRLLYDSLLAIAVLRYGVLFAAAGFVLHAGWMGEPALDGFLVAWLAAAVIVFLAVSTRPLLFLGEAERYLEYGLMPAFLLLAVLLPASLRLPVLVAIASWHAGLYLFHVALFLHRYDPSVKPHLADWAELVAALREEPTTVVLSLLGAPPWQLAYGVDHALCHREALTWLGSTERDYEDFYWRYPWPRPDFERVAERHGVGLIVVSKPLVEEARRQGYGCELSGLERIFENRTYALYRVPDSYLRRVTRSTSEQAASPHVAAREAAGGVRGSRHA